MKESSYYGTMRTKLVHEIGGKVIKISDKATLGLPDSMHIGEGVVSYIETKIHDLKDQNYFIPWSVIKKYVRQFEMCKEIRKHALVLYVIYCPYVKMTAVLDVKTIEEHFYRNEHILIRSSTSFVNGHGIELISENIMNWRNHVREHLAGNYGSSIS